MTKTTKRLAFATLFIVLVMSVVMAMSAFTTSSVNAASESASINTFDISGASVRIVEPTGIRFATKVNKTYRDQTLSGKNYEFGTLIIPVDVFDKSQETELSHKVVDVMDVKQTTWGEEVDGYYTFNAVLMNMPNTEYGRQLMARSYIKVDGGEPVYSETTITRTIAQVAAKTVAEYPEDDRELLDTYINAVAKSVAFTSDTLELDINESANLAVNTDPANYHVIYSVDDDSVISLDWTGKITALKAGTATITATFGEYSDTIEVVVSDTVVETFDNQDFTGWVTKPYDANHPITRAIISENGNKFAQFTVPGGGYCVIFNIPVPQYVVKGNWYNVSFDIWTESTLANASNNAQIFMQVVEPCYNATGKLTNDNKSGTFTMLAKIGDDGRMSTFKIFGLSSSEVTFNIDNMKYVHAPANFDIADKELVVAANSSITLNETVLGLTNVIGELSYKVDYMGADVALVDNTFTTANSGYYNVYVTVDDGKTSMTKLVVLVVNGTYLYSLNNVTNIASGDDWFVRNSSKGGSTPCEIVSENSGNKYYKFTSLVGEKTTFNMPLPTQEGLTLVSGKTYLVKFNLWTEDAISSGAIVAESAAPISYIKGRLDSTVKQITVVARFDYNGARFSTFYITNTTSSTITYCIDNISLEIDSIVMDPENKATLTFDAEQNYVYTNNTGWVNYRVFVPGMESLTAGTKVNITLTYKTIFTNNRAVLFAYNGETTSVSKTLLLNKTEWATETLEAVIFTSNTNAHNNNALTGDIPNHVKLALVSDKAAQTIIIKDVSFSIIN